MSQPKPGIQVVQGDITALEVDAIVNAANPALSPGSGVCGAIFRSAGPALRRACAALAPCPTGEARATPGFQLKAKAIIHAVGPVWHGGGSGEAPLLASCYRHSLHLAEQLGCRSIAFPAISTGVYGYPVEAAARIAVETCRAWLDTRDLPKTILLVAFDDANLGALKAALQEGQP